MNKVVKAIAFILIIPIQIILFFVSLAKLNK